MDSQTDNSLLAQILRFEEGYAILQNSHCEFKWPLTHLPTGYRIGDNIIITIQNSQNEKEDKLQTMKKLLEDLIN